MKTCSQTSGTLARKIKKPHIKKKKKKSLVENVHLLVFASWEKPDFKPSGLTALFHKYFMFP